MLGVGIQGESLQRSRAVFVAAALCFVDNMLQTSIVSFLPFRTTFVYTHLFGAKHVSMIFFITLAFCHRRALDTFFN